jgi:hypothetical protein
MRRGLMNEKRVQQIKPPTGKRLCMTYPLSRNGTRPSVSIKNVDLGGVVEVLNDQSFQFGENLGRHLLIDRSPPDLHLKLY